MATSTTKKNYTRGRSEQSEQIIVYLDELGWFQAIPKITYTEFAQFLQVPTSTNIWSFAQQVSILDIIRAFEGNNWGKNLVYH